MSAEITLREVYDILVEVRTDVTAIKKDLESNTNSVKDHEIRIRGLERAMWKAMGVASVIGASGGYMAMTFFP